MGASVPSCAEAFLRSTVRMPSARRIVAPSASMRRRDGTTTVPSKKYFSGEAGIVTISCSSSAFCNAAVHMFVPFTARTCAR